MYRLHTRCRACGFGPQQNPSGSKVYFNSNGQFLTPVLDLGVQPLANNFCSETDERAGHAPLKVLLCPVCGLAQLSVVVDPAILYTRYAYITSPSQTMHRHFETLWQDLHDEQKGAISSVLEVGSNDGALLSFFREKGVHTVLGYDPATNLAMGACANQIPTIARCFTEEEVETVLKMVRPVDLIVARHVFCHINDWKDFLKACAAVCHDRSLVYIEVPYVMDLLDKYEFDTIYHEHTSYLSLKAMTYALNGTGLKLDRVIRYSIHGGVVGLFLRRDEWKGDPHPSVEEMLQAENVSADRWTNFREVVELRILDLKKCVELVRQKNDVVCGFGASAKSTVWVNACGFSRKDIAFICDSTPQKQYRCSPGTDIPIVDEGALLRELPAYAIMFCWNYCDEVLEKHQLYRSKGGKFIIPVPTVQVV